MRNGRWNCDIFNPFQSHYAEDVSGAHHIHIHTHSSSSSSQIERERALGSTTTKLFGNDYFRLVYHISMRFLIVESSAPTRFSLLLCTRTGGRRRRRRTSQITAPTRVIAKRPRSRLRANVRRVNLKIPQLRRTQRMPVSSTPQRFLSARANA